MKRRGLAGVQLVISDAHEGLKKAVAKQLQGSSWQRCKVHFHRDVLGRVGKAHGETVNAMICMIFHQLDANGVRGQLPVVADSPAPRFPAIAQMLLDAEAELCAFTDFSKPHWRRIWSTNPLERVNKEIKRRTKVVGIFPDTPRSCDCRRGALDVHDEWQVTDRRYFCEHSMRDLLEPDPTISLPAELDAAEARPRFGRRCYFHHSAGLCLRK